MSKYVPPSFTDTSGPWWKGAMDAGFNESDHPRDKGKFSSGGGSKHQERIKGEPPAVGRKYKGRKVAKVETHGPGDHTVHYVKD